MVKGTMTDDLKGKEAGLHCIPLVRNGRITGRARHRLKARYELDN